MIQATYCWWLKSCTTWDVWNPINNGMLYISTGAGFLPSTVTHLIYIQKGFHFGEPKPVFRWLLTNPSQVVRCESWSKMKGHDFQQLSRVGNKTTSWENPPKDAEWCRFWWVVLKDLHEVNWVMLSDEHELWGWPFSIHNGDWLRSQLVGGGSHLPLHILICTLPRTDFVHFGIQVHSDEIP